MFTQKHVHTFMHLHLILVVPLSECGRSHTWEASKETSRTAEVLPGKGRIVLMVTDEGFVQGLRPGHAVQDDVSYKQTIFDISTLLTTK